MPTHVEQAPEPGFIYGTNPLSAVVTQGFDGGPSATTPRAWHLAVRWGGGMAVLEPDGKHALTQEWLRIDMTGCAPPTRFRPVDFSAVAHFCVERFAPSLVNGRPVPTRQMRD